MPSTLPRPLSSFIGREDVLAEVVLLLHDTRLLTLTGPGGSGKTGWASSSRRASAPTIPMALISCR